MKKAIFITVGAALVLAGAIILHQMYKDAGQQLKIGASAPDFSLSSSDGSMFTLSKVLGKKAIVIFFYPKDFSPGCTTEVCTFRDSFEIFKAAGADVIGVSSDSVESHQKFIKEHNLPFSLLSDPTKAVRKLYRIRNSGGVIPGRITFVLDKKGIIRFAFSSQFDAARHVEEAKKVVEEIAKEKIKDQNTSATK